MSAPVVWVVIPILLGIGLLAIQNRPRLTAWVGILAAVLLALLAWILPVTPGVHLGPLPLSLDPTMTVLGRTLTLDAGNRPFLILVYALAALWFTGAGLAGANRLFIPIGLAMIAFLVAATAVEPFLYAALFIEIAVLISVPLLSPPGQPIQPGILRYLIFQTLGMPFILFTGWMLTGVESGSANLALTVRAELLLGLGFAFLLAVFPFYTWIPLLAEQAQPYVSGFVLSVLPTVVLLFALNFMDRYSWLRDSSVLYVGLRLIGTLMVVTGGVWAAFQRHLGRMFGYAVIVETGFSLLSISMSEQGGLPLFALLFLPRLMGLAVWALSLSILQQQAGTLELSKLQGFGRFFPVVMVGLVAAPLSIAGLPLLADFPIKQVILNGIARQSSVEAYWILAGSFGLMVAALRSLATFLRQPVVAAQETPEGEGQAGFQIQETYAEILLVALGVLVLVVAGIFPQLFQASLLSLLRPFSHLPL